MRTFGGLRKGQLGLCFKLWLAAVTTVREPSGGSRDWALDLKRKCKK